MQNILRMSYCDIGAIVEINRIGLEELSFEWQLSKPTGSDECYLSPYFSIGEENLCFKLWLKCMNVAWDPTSGWMKLCIFRINGILPKTFHIKVGIKGSTGVVKATEVTKEFSCYDYYYWNEFCSRFALTEYKSRLMMDEMLTITCVIKIVAPFSATDNGESFKRRKFLKSGEDSFPNKKFRGIEMALQDFGKLLASGEDSDVTVQVGGVEFRVHRLILSARSPVFSAMLRHDTAERACNKIIIEDCEPEVFKEYLQYLYTGFIKFLPLSQQNIFSLFQVADKYLANNLKQQCLKHIEEGLCVQTFYDTVLLALMYGENSLLEKAIAFATENIFLNSFYLKQNLLGQ